MRLDELLVRRGLSPSRSRAQALIAAGRWTLRVHPLTGEPRGPLCGMGVCLECEEPISAKRLDAVPWARYCVACQERIAARIAEGEFVDEYQEAGR